ncbi:unnamed protein product [Medioppia subpectinata]|uniref:Uncharacterized protein n=1 Tax=Medioppia subpectinata TaxID=1979941 RepID=A0A7R9KGY7_9ACAR|nr:unnamed protein product [Medioppia subpectinata]CAG2102431.1 unnamed protein product [Medioppia subpectinata]
MDSKSVSNDKKELKDATNSDDSKPQELKLRKDETPEDNQLGPKVLGLFENGQIQQFIENRHFKVPEQKDPQLSAELFKKMAGFHAMDVPIKRTNGWLYENFFDNFYDRAFKDGSFDLCDELKCETLNARDLQTEIQWLKAAIDAIGSPIVFSHNDLKGYNIMVTKVNNKEGVMLCDFEYSCYSYRGYDFGTVFAEWDHGDYTKLQHFPDDSVIETLVGHYINESVSIFGSKYADNKINSVQQLMKEVKLFTLVSNMVSVMFGIQNHQGDAAIQKDGNRMMGLVDIAFKNYFHLKNKFLAQNVF